MLQTFCSCLEKQPLPKPGTLLGCEAIWKVVREKTELVRALPDGADPVALDESWLQSITR